MGFKTVAIGHNRLPPPRLHSVSEVALSRLVEKLEDLEVRPNDARWAYDTQADESQFISPARVLSGKRKSPRIMPIY